MWTGISSSVAVVAYLGLFSGVAIIFLFANLLIGKFVRPANPHAEKLEIYECGEPTIGSSYVQFDLRFYVVALLFIIFDVEVAFFFPWATVFGKSNHLAKPDTVVAQRIDGKVQLTPDAKAFYRELGVRNPEAISVVPASLKGTVAVTNDAEAQANAIARAGGRQLALVSIVDILVFFAVLIVGFLYVWQRGDLDWVRAVDRRKTTALGQSAGLLADEEAALSA